MDQNDDTIKGMTLVALVIMFVFGVVAGAAMALSSVSVMANALLLKRWRPPHDAGRRPAAAVRHGRRHAAHVHHPEKAR